MKEENHTFKKNLLKKNQNSKLFKRISILSIIFLISYITIGLLLSNQPYFCTIFAYTMIAILYFMVTFSLFLATRHVKKYGQRTQLAWGLLTFSVLLSTVASVMWAIIIIYFNLNPATSVADLFYLLFFPVFLLGIFVFPSTRKNNHQRYKAYFDIGMVLFSAFLVIYTFFISPAAEFYQGDLLKLVFSLAYVVAGLLLLWALLDLIFNRIKINMQTPFIILVLGIFILTITSTLYAYQLITGTYVPGDAGDVGWLVGYTILGLAGAAQFTNFNINRNRHITRFLSWHYSYHWTPYLALAGIFISYSLLIWAVNTSNPNLLFLEAGSGVLIFMVITRQIVSIRENRDLYHQAQKEIKTRRKVEESLQKSESLYRTIFENTGTATLIIDKKNRLCLTNSEFERITGYSQEEVLEKTWQDLVDKESQKIIEELHKDMNRDYDHTPRTVEIKFIDKEGMVKDGFLIFTLIPGTEDFLASLLDMTQRKKDHELVKKSLKEKEVLLKEIHHRVKNNLMIISSLLNLQSHYIDDKEHLEIFRESQSRANSMALIHERLYKSSDLKSIDFGDYIQNLAREIFHSYSTTDSEINLIVDVEEVMLDIDNAIPLGLILNELLTNSMKYAFPQGESGEIKVKFSKKDKTYTLIVEDNGVGFPPRFDYKNTDSLGLQLINNLTAQISGELELDTTNGTCFKIEFLESGFHD